MRPQDLRGGCGNSRTRGGARPGCGLWRTGGAQQGNLNSQERTPRLRWGFAKRFLRRGRAAGSCRGHSCRCFGGRASAPRSEPSVPKFVSVPKDPKIAGPPAKLARGGTEVRIPVRLVPASSHRSVYISDAELDRGVPSSSEATHTPKSVPPSPGSATQRSASRASHPPPAPPRQKARPRSASATPIAGSVPPAFKGCSVTRTIKHPRRRATYGSHWG